MHFSKYYNNKRGKVTFSSEFSKNSDIKSPKFEKENNGDLMSKVKLDTKLPIILEVLYTISHNSTYFGGIVSGDTMNSHQFLRWKMSQCYIDDNELNKLFISF